MRVAKGLLKQTDRSLCQSTLAFTAVLLLSACSSESLGKPGAETTGGGSNEPGAGGTAAGPGTAGVDYRREIYPAGPYGFAVGAIMENYAFLGWREPAAIGYDVTKLETVRLSEFFAPDGQTKLLWINSSAVWCGVCRAEMKDIKDRGINASLGAKGLVMIETLFEDNDTNPATPADLKLWGSLPDHSIDYPLLLDPGFKLGAFFSSDATPLNMLVDPKTMRVIQVTMGYSSDYWQEVEQALDR